ncbi:hypothetical protein [Burkholderia alba]|uniref:hypothetical protein n=1 Tax=Burkholderia alba TaxID=2683677 RepID=UPI002B05B5F0|nr:hypothetical protein [Burkholderia alba]
MHNDRTANDLSERISLAWTSLPTDVQILIALAVVIALLFAHAAYRSTKLRKQRDDDRDYEPNSDWDRGGSRDPINKATYDPKQFRRPR